MSRSLRVAPKYIEKVKSALKRNSFPSQKAFATEVGMSRATASKFLNGKPVDYLNFVEISEKLGLDWQAIAYLEDGESQQPVSIKRQDWGEAPDVSVCYGRTEELNELKKWIIEDRCRLVALLGFGGIGKTTISVKLAQSIQSEFDCVIWRSLRNAPPLERLLEDLIKFLSKQQETDLPKTIDDRISKLIDYLRKYRCLLILDNLESIMQKCTPAGSCLKDREKYEQLLKLVGEIHHQSCLLLTSREKPQEIALQEGERLPVRSLQISGLSTAEVQEIFQTIGSFSASPSEWEKLNDRYGGNPQLLKLVATNIKDVFGCSIDTFLEQTLFNGVRELLEQHFQRLSELEKDLMYWLAIIRYPVNLFDLKITLLPSVPERQLLDAIKSLKHRFLIEPFNEGYTQQTMVMEYMTNRLVEEVYNEIVSEKILIFNRYSLTIATAPFYVRKAQDVFVMERVKYLLIANIGGTKNAAK